MTAVMPPRVLLAIGVAFAIAPYSSSARADNPIVQTIYTSDPAPFVHEGRVYVYTGHDEDNLVDDFFTMNEWRVYSSSDMVNWTDHGSPLRYSDFDWSRGDAWAGQVIYRSGKFYYYIPTTSASLGRKAIGVAVSDGPIGPFEDALGHPLITENCGDIDPTVYIDDDGQAYLYWGNPSLCYVKLNEDMISYQGSVVHVPMTTASFGTRTGDASRATTYEEGPWFYKRGSLYYLVFAAGPISEHIGYSTSSTPTGPWTYRGVIMPTQGASFTNHAGVVDFMGRSYFFYHNGALPGGGGFHRSVCVEEFSYDADGSWPTIDMTEDGPPSAANLNPYVQTEAETMAWASGVETEICSEGGMNVASIDNADHIELKAVDFGSGAVSFDARVASAANGGSIELRLDSLTGTLAGTCSVQRTGDWQSWVTTTCPVSGATGIHDLYFRFTGGSGSLFNFNWWRFTARDPGDAGVADAGPAESGGGGGSGSGGASGNGAGTDAQTAGTGGRIGQVGGASGTNAGGAGNGDVAGTAGSAAGTGAAGAGMEVGGNDSAAADSSAGCACRSAASGSDTAPAALLLFLGAVVGWRRARRTRRRSMP